MTVQADLSKLQQRAGRGTRSALLAAVAQIYIKHISDRERDVVVGLSAHYLGKIPFRGERLVCFVNVVWKRRGCRTMRPTETLFEFLEPNEVRAIEVIRDADGLPRRLLGGDGRVGMNKVQEY